MQVATGADDDAVELFVLIHLHGIAVDSRFGRAADLELCAKLFLGADVDYRNKAAFIVALGLAVRHNALLPDSAGTRAETDDADVIRF